MLGNYSQIKMKLSMKCFTEDQTRVEETICQGKSVDKPLVSNIYVTLYNFGQKDTG